MSLPDPMNARRTGRFRSVTMAAIAGAGAVCLMLPPSVAYADPVPAPPAPAPAEPAPAPPPADPNAPPASGPPPRVSTDFRPRAASSRSRTRCPWNARITVWRR
uniref:APA family fibronectin-binding glycoprotein n=1 Tax=Mycolicibacterium fallax TaxID=1793 RepID=UPI003908B9F8